MYLVSVSVKGPFADLDFRDGLTLFQHPSTVDDDLSASEIFVLAYVTIEFSSDPSLD